MSESVKRDLSEAIGALGLPVAPEYLEVATAEVLDVATRHGVAPDDVAQLLLAQWANWRRNTRARPGRTLDAAINAALTSDPGTNWLKGHYFATYRTLVGSGHYMSASSALALLGNARLISSLVHVHKMTASQVAAIIGRGVNYGDVQALVRYAPTGRPTITRPEIQAVIEADAEDEARIFLDADDSVAIGLVSRAAEEVGYRSELGADLARLHEVGFEPYFVLLHYELLIVEKYDKSPGRSVYEFNPRGGAVRAVESLYSVRGIGSQPYLNNAKGVAHIDATWAENRILRGSADTVDAPLRLAQIFADLSELPYPARHRLARLVRAWLMRRLRVFGGTRPRDLPILASNARVQLLRGIGARNTATRGVLEQRWLDLASTLAHPALRHRGRGDSVNATNWSAKKLGDVEYLDPVKYNVTSYEAHGGSFQDDYVDAHVATLQKTLTSRAVELSELAEPAAWWITVRFVAHDTSRVTAAARARVLAHEDFEVFFEFYTYDQLAERLGGYETISAHAELFNELVHSKLAEVRVPGFIKDRYLELAQWNS